MSSDLKEHIVVLTGAGISAESGLSTFRDAGGLWEGYDINEVASVEGWFRDPETVLDFYNKRRVQAFKAEPNAAHYALASLQEKFEVTVITQNVDDLHERAGSLNVIHLHGMLRQGRSEDNPEQIVDLGEKPINIGDKAPDGTQLRPNVVWFGEPVPMISKAAEVVPTADLFMVVGTSLAVYPAAGLVDYTQPGIDKYLIDPGTPELLSFDGWTHIQESAATGLSTLTKNLLDKDYE
ncbi:Sir2 family NAD-dependent protein deacetylase [Rhodohalobacter halophilus]|uniref:Sir2 family NAD-dependent protein deacetylase n=1 Tax=Rhodohalobacter halophilus TaxID=1812810 RepID=UPI00083FB05F|nr:Sir2 family NAD-dependent protein deacetylase [Rhodohalobacter halophilus]